MCYEILCIVMCLSLIIFYKGKMRIKYKKKLNIYMKYIFYYNN